MDADRLSIAELADAAGLSRRAVRFYVQQKLLPAPHGLGRGKHYDPSHLTRLRRVMELQRAGHSLDEIRHLIGRDGVTPEPAKPSAKSATKASAKGGRAVADVASSDSAAADRVAPVRLRAELWRRLNLLEGVELSFDASRFNPTVEELLALRQAVVRAFKPELLDEDQNR